MNSSIDVRNKSFDPGLIALLMFNKKNMKKPLNFPIHLKIPKPLVKMIFDYAVGEQIKITVHLDFDKHSLTVNPTTKLSEIASVFNENHKIRTENFSQCSGFDPCLLFRLQNEIQIEMEMLQICIDPTVIQNIQLRINDIQVRMDKALELYKVAEVVETKMLAPDHKSLRDCAIQDGHELALIY